MKSENIFDLNFTKEDIIKAKEKFGRNLFLSCGYHLFEPFGINGKQCVKCGKIVLENEKYKVFFNGIGIRQLIRRKKEVHKNYEKRK